MYLNHAIHKTIVNNVCRADVAWLENVVGTIFKGNN